MTHEEIVATATKMMEGAPEYVDDALRFAPVGNSVVGSLLSLLHHVPRQYAEPAALEAARKISGSGRKRSRRKP